MASTGPSLTPGPFTPDGKGVRALVRRNFLSGVLVVIPLAVAVWILAGALGALWQLPDVLPRAWRPESLFHNRAAALVIRIALMLSLAGLLALGISILGWMSKQFLGKKMLDFVESRIIERIPIVRSIYSALDQLLQTMAAGGGGQQFSRVVYVEYPRRGSWALAFVTGAAKGPNVMPGHLNVYVPTTPNPTSGFHLMVPEAEVRESQMKVEEAFKTILSLGIAQPAASPIGSPTVSDEQESDAAGRETRE